MWHYVQDGKAVGPVSEDQIGNLFQQGILHESTLVWKEGMAEWKNARAAGFCAAREAGFPSFASPPRPPPTTPTSDLTEEKGLPALAHVLGLFTGFLGPLVLLLAARQPETRAHARRALNWQISLMIYLVAAIPLCFVVIGFFLILAAIILDFVFCIRAAVKARNREFRSYPLAIPFLKD